MRLARLLALALLILSLTPLPALARDTLRVLAWPGYADPDHVRAFEERFQVKVEVTLVGSDEVLWDKFNTHRGADYDVLALNTAELQRYIKAGLVRALDLTHLPNQRNQSRAFADLRTIPGITRGGQVFGIPYTFAEMGLIYDRKRVPQPPRSMAALWDPRYRGQVLAFDSAAHNFSLAALSFGGRSPFNLNDAEIRGATQRLIALRRNVRAFYSMPEEAVSLFRENPVALIFANYGSQQLRLLREAGADVGYVIPDEGALAWLDCWAVSGAAPNPSLAEAWINFTLERVVSSTLTTRHGLANTLDEPPSLGGKARIVWLEPVEDIDRRIRLWRRILAGDRPARLEQAR